MPLASRAAAAQELFVDCFSEQNSGEAADCKTMRLVFSVEGTQSELIGSNTRVTYVMLVKQVVDRRDG